VKAGAAAALGRLANARKAGRESFHDREDDLDHPSSDGARAIHMLS
jgi:hypothetical protein